MSCKACEEAEEATYKGDRGVYYFRWKNANVAIIACDEHTNEIMSALRDVQRQDEIKMKNIGFKTLSEKKE